MSILNWSRIENSWITRDQFHPVLFIIELFLDDQISIYLLLVISGKPLDSHHIVLATNFHDRKLLDEQMSLTTTNNFNRILLDYQQSINIDNFEAKIFLIIFNIVFN